MNPNFYSLGSSTRCGCHPLYHSTLSSNQFSLFSECDKPLVDTSRTRKKAELHAYCIGRLTDDPKLSFLLHSSETWCVPVENTHQMQAFIRRYNCKYSFHERIGMVPCRKYLIVITTTHYHSHAKKSVEFVIQAL